MNAAEGEFAGVFVSKQPGDYQISYDTTFSSQILNYYVCFFRVGDTDMGGKKPKNILSKGIFYGHLEPL